MKKHAEVAIIGSGIAGSLLAWKLTLAGKDVALFESGPRLNRQQLYQRFLNHGVHNVYPPVSNVINEQYLDSDTKSLTEHFHVLRLAGGTTWHWGGICLRYHEEDFQLKTRYGVGVDWPVSLQDLKPFYAEAERCLGVSGSHPEDFPHLPMTYLDKQVMQAGEKAGIRMEQLPQARLKNARDGRSACLGYNNCTPICPTGAQYAAEVHLLQAMEAGANLFSDSLVTSLDVDGAGKIQHLRYRDREGLDQEFSAKHYILAANGLENVRLMLQSGLSQRSDAVGRYLMAHPGGTVSFASGNPMYGGRGPQIGIGYREQSKGKHRSERAAYYVTLSNTIDPVQELSASLREGALGKNIYEQVTAEVNRQVKMFILAEQLPDKENRLIIDETKKNRTGLPELKALMQVDDYTLCGIQNAQAQIRRLAREMDAVNINYYPKKGESHIMGATRMGTDPSTSVVNADSICHEHQNLSVAGSSIFPTGATANPTLTIAALSLRLARHLEKNLT